MKWLARLRRRVTKQAIFAALQAAPALASSQMQSLGLGFGRLATLLPFLRERLTRNLRAAGVDASDETVRTYFRRLGLWLGDSLGVYAKGLDDSMGSLQIAFDPVTVRHVDEAVARGNGLLMVSPHVFWHEIAFGMMHRRHPVTALVRESKDASWSEIKSRWYGTALGLHTVMRPRRGSAGRDMVAMLRALREGTVLGITPDVVAPRGSGIPVTLFGRTASLPPGMILLAVRSGAPMIMAGRRWSRDASCPNRERLTITFSPPIDLPRRADLDSCLREGLQRWCHEFEAFLRQSPADWLFWLDKAWTSVLRQPRTSRAEAA